MCAYTRSVLRHTCVSVSHLRVCAHGCACVNLHILTSAQPHPANGPQEDCIHQGTCLQSSLKSGSIACVHLVKLGRHWPSPVNFGLLRCLTRAKHPTATEKSLAHSNCSLSQVKKCALGSAPFLEMETRTPEVGLCTLSLSLLLFSSLEQPPCVPLAAQILFSAAHPPDSGHSGTYEHVRLKASLHSSLTSRPHLLSCDIALSLIPHP